MPVSKKRPLKARNYVVTFPDRGFAHYVIFQMHHRSSARGKKKGDLRSYIFTFFIYSPCGVDEEVVGFLYPCPTKPQ